MPAGINRHTRNVASTAFDTQFPVERDTSAHFVRQQHGLHVICQHFLSNMLLYIRVYSLF